MVGDHPVDRGGDGILVGDVELPDVELDPGLRGRLAQRGGTAGVAQRRHDLPAGPGRGDRGGQADPEDVPVIRTTLEDVVWARFVGEEHD